MKVIKDVFPPDYRSHASYDKRWYAKDKEQKKISGKKVGNERRRKGGWMQIVTGGRKGRREEWMNGWRDGTGVEGRACTLLPSSTASYASIIVDRVWFSTNDFVFTWGRHGSSHKPPT